jgi:hypothetical protein
MVRVGRDSHGEWYRGRGEGRGAWLCPEDCASHVQVSHLARVHRRSFEADDAAKVRELAASKRP